MTADLAHPVDLAHPADLVLPAGRVTPDGPRPSGSRRTTVLHLSDVHATAAAPLYGVVDGITRMRAASDYARAAGLEPDAIVISGDLIERGNAAAYPALRDALLELEDSWGVPVLSVLGNHDERAAARILPGHRAPVGARAEDASPRAVRVGAWRFVLLDSSTGTLGAEQLAWLDAELRLPAGTSTSTGTGTGSSSSLAPSGTVVVMHHPPLGSPLPMLARAGLRDAADFLDIVEGTDVRAILCGHFHHPLSATMRGVHVSAGPALAYHQVMDAEPGTVSGFDRSMFSLVHLGADGVSASSVGVEHPALLFTLTPTPTTSQPSPVSS
ncbi:3',5'-cyclic AMP phosphodiesterase CpdA [Pseudoclavibacter sp. JAI123]|uniref:metallophosphoesterase family protein n=1 Tax=Pseudoclavibacter sp. JAI123 TaxID=2723065 RepID=UPI0015C6D1CB|nr:metallophosphoesterase [Pseudoclavibacter sp. JAI123]NYF14736.1 3',5'-cyclic AMP phosphodiesterase CpdA [Pseudoclavibacter sp. JAI123]